MSQRGATGEGEGEGDDGAEATLSRSEIHDVLRNERRRLVLERLWADGSETVRELSEQIGAVEAGETPPPRNVRQSVYVSLHQTHLPKLDDLGIVVYDDDAKEVSLAARAADLERYTPRGADDDAVRPWSELQLAAAGVGLVAVGVAFPTGSGVALVVAALALVAVAALGTAEVAFEGSEYLGLEPVVGE
jgi:predicted transcriptional regulator